MQLQLFEDVPDRTQNPAALAAMGVRPPLRHQSYQQLSGTFPLALRLTYRETYRVLQKLKAEMAMEICGQEPRNGLILAIPCNSIWIRTAVVRHFSDMPPRAG
jgi:hypothetical protein